MSITLVKYKELLLENIKIVIGLGGSVLLSFLVILPAVSSLPKLYESNQKQQAQLSTLSRRLSKINNLVSTQQAVKSSVTLADRALPGKDDIPGLMNQIQAISTSSGVTLKSLQFGGITKPEDGNYKKINMQAVMEGNFANFLTLLGNLEDTSRLIDVVGVSFDSQKGGGLTASLGLASYFAESVPAGVSSNLDFAAKPISTTLEYLKKLKPYEPQTVNVTVGKTNPFQ